MFFSLGMGDICAWACIHAYDWHHDSRSPVLVEDVTQQDQIGDPWNLNYKTELEQVKLLAEKGKSGILESSFCPFLTGEVVWIWHLSEREDVNEVRAT